MRKKRIIAAVAIVLTVVTVAGIVLGVVSERPERKVARERAQT